jgi:transposase
VIPWGLRITEEVNMPWCKADRDLYKARGARYSTDLTDEEYALVEPLLPARKKRGSPRHSMRAILDAIVYMVRAGCPWRLIPKNFPPFTTVQYWFYGWRDSGFLDQALAVLSMAAREQEGREAAATAVVVDSQSVKTTEMGGDRGFEAGKKVKGRKRHLAVDTLGLPIVIQITAADVQDRDQLAPILAEVHKRNPWISVAFVDAGYQGDEAQRASFEASKIACTVVKRTDKEVKGFVVLPKRWVVERTFGWLNLARRLAKDFERTIASARAWLQFALMALLLRRVTRRAKACSGH